MALIIDIETSGQSDLPYVEADNTPPSNYGPEAVAKWHEKNKATIAKAAALNPRTGRIVAIGIYNDLEPDRELREPSSPRLFQWLLHGMTLALVGATGVGLVLAFRSVRPQWPVWVALGLGVALPVGALLLGQGG